MVRKLLNIEELSEICSKASYSPKHIGLLAAIHSRYPDMSIKLVTVRGGWNMPGGLLDDNGNRIADSYFEWLDSKYTEAGENAQKVWTQFMNSGYIANRKTGETIYITMPFADSPEDFIQIEVHAIREDTYRYLFNNKSRRAPKDLGDLKDPTYFDSDTVEPGVVAPWHYEFRKLTNVRKFIKEMLSNEQTKRLAKVPEYERKNLRVHDIVIGDVTQKPKTRHVSIADLDPGWFERPMNEMRILQDWANSSAGRSGARFCEHWALDMKDSTWNEERYMGFIPLWSDGDGGLKLPVIQSRKCKSVYELMGKLERFDKRVGHPFAWYFYLLHGNRMEFPVGRRVAEGIKSGLIRLQAHDEEVLLRWYAEEYGF